MEEPFEIVRRPVQSPGLAGAGVPVPLPIMSDEVLDANIIQQRVNESHNYLNRLRDDGSRHACTLDDEREAERYKAEVQATVLFRPLLRIIPPANGNGGEGDVLALLREFRDDTRQQHADTQQQLANIQRQHADTRRQLANIQRQHGDTRQQLDNIQQQLTILQYNAQAMSFNASAVNPQAPITALRNNAGIVPAIFPATLGDFHNLDDNRARALLRHYRDNIPRDANVKSLLGLHIGLRVAA